GPWLPAFLADDAHLTGHVRATLPHSQAPAQPVVPRSPLLPGLPGFAGQLRRLPVVDRAAWYRHDDSSGTRGRSSLWSADPGRDLAGEHSAGSPPVSTAGCRPLVP